jgi:hypothetical protein
MTMRISRDAATIILSVWLILTGLFALLDIGFSGLSVLMGLLAIAAGVLLLLASRPFGRPTLGRILLGLYLVAVGLMALAGSASSGLGALAAVLAIAAGILLLWPGWRFIRKTPGWFLLALYLIVVGLMSLVGLSFSGIGVIVAVLAIAAGVLLLLGR